MPITTTLPSGLDEVDVIVCGGGLAACVVAGRLAEADRDLVILVVEGGPNNAGVEIVQQPALWVMNLLPNSKTALFYKSKQSKQVADREVVVQTGGTLGGGSSINIMLYSRPAMGDFDAWNTPGWSGDDLLPYMKKIESYHGTGNDSMHGKGGPLQITKNVKHGSRGPTDFLRAAESLGMPTTTGLQDGLPESIGYEYANNTITKDGKRHDAASAYVHPKLNDHPNLHVLCETKVDRILFDSDKCAVGVEISPSRPMSEGTPKDGTGITIRARKMVVASCGAIASPLLLERSGIGSPKVLKKASVPVVVDLPGVGAEYQDHNYVPWAYHTDLDSDDLLHDLWRGQISAGDAAAKGLLASSGCDLHGKLRPSASEVEALGPEFEAAWKKDFADHPGKPLMLAAGASTADPTLPPAQYFSAGHYTAYPYSRGKVHITGPSLQDPIDFETGYFTDTHDLDLKKAVWAYKKTREIMRRTSMYRGEAPEEHPVFPIGSKAGLYRGEKSLVSQGEVKSLQYSAEDDKAIEQRLRERIATTWHSLGTCPMKSKEAGGVVDKDLNVYGVQGLKVIDLSIAPENVGANTQITTYTIGEKGADIVIKELGLGQQAVNGTIR